MGIILGLVILLILYLAAAGAIMCFLFLVAKPDFWKTESEYTAHRVPDSGIGTGLFVCPTCETVQTASGKCVKCGTKTSRMSEWSDDLWD